MHGFNLFVRYRYLALTYNSSLATGVYLILADNCFYVVHGILSDRFNGQYLVADISD